MKQAAEHTYLSVSESAALAAEVVSRLNNGDERAFAAIFDHFQQRLFFFAMRFVQHQDAQDTVSEAFVKLWEKRQEFATFDGISHFLFVLVRNRCLDLLRHQAIRNQKQAELLHRLENPESQDWFLEEVHAELVSHVYSEIRKLPPRMQKVFVMSFQKGMKPAAIAAELGISVQTVSNQKFNAIRLLQAALKEHSLACLLLLIFAQES